MSLNLTNKTAYHQFDEFGMLCIPSDRSWEKRSWWKKLWDKILKREWMPSWKNESWKDSIGRTVLAWIAYGMPEELDKALDECLDEHTEDDIYKLHRHPYNKELASRDHWSYFIIQSYLNVSTKTWLINSIEDKAIPSMRGMNLWMNALTGDKRAEWWYYFWAIPGAYIGNCFLRFCRWAGRISPELSNHGWLLIGNTYLHNRTRLQKLWAWIIFTSMPAYALHNKAWQIYVMPASRKKEKLKRILLSRIGISNIMLRLLLGEGRRTLYDDLNYPNTGVYKRESGVTQEEIDAYPDMTGYRPGVYLDETCRRDIRELTDKEAEFNTYEKSLIIWLWKLNKP